MLNKIKVPHKIGIFDSGIGGLSVLNSLLELASFEYYYVADSAHLPYGQKSAEYLLQRGILITTLLQHHNVSTIFVACHTFSALALKPLQALFPTVTFIDTLLPTIEHAHQATTTQKIGIMATQATIASHMHQKLLQQREPRLEIFEQACPLLVPLIEQRPTSPDNLLATLNRYIQPLRAKNIDTLILGCTHYAFLEQHIASLAPELTIISAQKSIKHCITPVLENLQNSTSLFFTSGETTPFLEKIEQFSPTISTKNVISFDQPPQLEQSLIEVDVLKIHQGRH